MSIHDRTRTNSKTQTHHPNHSRDLLYSLSPPYFILQKTSPKPFIPMAFQIQPELLNFVFIPFMAPGHSIPMIDLAKLFAERGVNVTIIVTPLNAARFSSVINRAVESGRSIRLLQAKFPGEEAGLPPGCESAETLPSYELIPNFFTAVKMLQQPIEEELRNLNPLPSCIICDKHIPWTAETCKNFGIPRIIFDGMSCFAPLVTHVLYVSKVHETVPPNEPFAVPDFPDEIEFTRFQLPGLLNPSPWINFYDFREQVKKTEEEAYGVVVNSFEELEKDYFEIFWKLKGGKVWCVGPLSLYGKIWTGLEEGIRRQLIRIGVIFSEIFVRFET